MTSPLPVPAPAPASRRGAGIRWAGWLCAVWLCGFAQAQEPGEALRRIVCADAARLLDHADATVRGEAALIVASEQDPAHHNAVVAIAADRDPAARLRGIVALGVQATPGVDHSLRTLLDTPHARAEPAGVAAAFALGLLPTAAAGSLHAEVLSAFLQGSLRRQRDAQIALVLGLRRRDASALAGPLLRLHEEVQARDPEFAAELLALLLPFGAAFDRHRFERLLADGSDAERCTLLDHLADAVGPLDPALERTVEGMARRGPAAVRAAALRTLSQKRQTRCLELAVDALAAEDPTLLAAATRAVLSLGGASTRDLLERHVLETRQPRRKTALLSAFAAPPSPALLDHCAALAANRTETLDVRRAAAFLLDRAMPRRAAPLLRDLFREDDTAAGKRRIAMRLCAGADEPPPIARLLEPGESLRRQPAAFHALLAAQHPDAERELLALLRDRTAPAGELATGLRAYRCRNVIALPPDQAALLPASLQAILADAP